VAWGDYDKDGKLDLFVTGISPSAVSRLYRNLGGGVFADVTATAFPGGILPNVAEGSMHGRLRQ